MLVHYAIAALAIMGLGTVWALVLFLARRQQPEAHIGEKSRGCLGCFNKAACPMECEENAESCAKDSACPYADEKGDAHPESPEHEYAHRV